MSYEKHLNCLGSLQYILPGIPLLKSEEKLFVHCKMFAVGLHMGVTTLVQMRALYSKKD